MLKTLLRKQMTEIFRTYFYDTRKSKPRSKASTIFLFVMFGVLMIGVLGTMFTLLSVFLCAPLTEAGLAWMYFTVMALLAILLGAFGSVFNTFAGLYLAKDNDLLLSMPIPVRYILTARLLGVYLLGLMYSGVLLLPAVIVYWCMASFSLQSVLGGILLILTVSGIVLFLSCALGWVVAQISRKLRNKSLITVLISLILQMHSSEAKISELNAASTSALSNAEALQAENRSLQDEKIALEQENKELQAKLDELNAQITALSGAASGGTTRITAPVSGTYSAVADGYESVLTPEVLETMTPSQLSSAAPQSVSTTVGKLIQGNAWYFAANVNEEDAASLKENSRLTLRMVSGVDFDLPVTLTRISAAENGKCLIVLKSTRYLSYMTLLREQNAELIISAYDGLRVPKNALRVDENGVSGVYCLVGRVAYFKPVSIVYQGSDYCLVEPGTIEAATESQKSLYTLRPNDEVIVSAGELYNGKVVD